jgi:DNA-binding GntR family transcriptional regulator
MEEYDIGRSFLKDILVKLKNECLIEIFPQSGTFVKKLNINEIREVFQMRISLELLAAKLVPSHITNKQLNSMNFLLSEIRGNINTLFTNEFKNMTDTIHNIYYEAIDNKRLAKTLYELYNLCSRVWFAQGNYYRSFQINVDQWQKKLI